MRSNGASSDDEKRISLLVTELIRLSEKRYAPCYSDFLGESEQLIAQRELAAAGQSDFEFYGGYENAQRAMLCVYPPFEKPEKSAFPFETVCLSFRKSAQLTHRDFLGALMGLGIKREAVGDIVTVQGAATFFIKKELFPYVSTQLEKVGREGVKLGGDGAPLDNVKQEYEEFSKTVSSMRIDAVVSECTNLSREKAQQAVKSGLAAVNGQIVYAPDHRVRDADKISVRGYGKYIINTDGSLSKKGKLRLKVKKYK